MTTPMIGNPTQTGLTKTGFVEVCPLSRLVVNRGVAALIGTTAVALFLLEDGTVRAIDNLDPCSGASVLSRGLVGDAGGVWTVASPMYKQRFSLSDGRCLDAEDTRVTVHDVALQDGAVCVRLARPAEVTAA